MFRISLLFIIILVFSSLILAPLFEMRADFLFPVFLVSLIFIMEDYRKIVFTGLTFSLIAEMYLGHNLGTMALPFLLTLAVFMWFLRLVNLKSTRLYQGEAVTD